MPLVFRKLLLIMEFSIRLKKKKVHSVIQGYLRKTFPECQEKYYNMNMSITRTGYYLKVGTGLTNKRGNRCCAEKHLRVYCPHHCRKHNLWHAIVSKRLANTRSSDKQLYLMSLLKTQIIKSTCNTMNKKGIGLKHTRKNMFLNHCKS